MGFYSLKMKTNCFRSQVSPYFSEVYYCYYGEEESIEDDQKEWAIESSLEENVENRKFRLPDFIKIVFNWEEQNLERTNHLAIKNQAPSGIEEEGR